MHKNAMNPLNALKSLSKIKYLWSDGETMITVQNKKILEEVTIL